MAHIAETFAPRFTAIEAAFDRIGRFFETLRAAQNAAVEFDRLSAMSDQALATKGYDRSTVTRAILDRHFN